MNSSERSKMLAYFASSLFTVFLIILAWNTTGWLNTVLAWGTGAWYVFTIAGTPWMASYPDTESVVKIGLINAVLGIVILGLFAAAVSGYGALVVAMLALVAYLGFSAIASR